MFTDFEYDGESLSDYKLMVGVINGSSGVQTVSSGAELTFNQVRPVGSSRFNRLFNVGYVVKMGINALKLTRMALNTFIGTEHLVVNKLS